MEYSIRGLTAFKVLTEQIGFAVQRISSKTTELTAFYGFDDSFRVNELAAGSVNKDGAVFHLADEFTGNHLAVFFDVPGSAGR